MVSLADADFLNFVKQQLQQPSFFVGYISQQGFLAVFAVLCHREMSQLTEVPAAA